MCNENKWCSHESHIQKKKLSLIDKEIGYCKWCKKYFCQMHNKIESHFCSMCNREVDKLSIKFVSKDEIKRKIEII